MWGAISSKNGCKHTQWICDVVVGVGGGMEGGVDLLGFIWGQGKT